MSLLQKASIITTPTAYAEDYLYSIKPAYALGSELVVNGDGSSTTGWSVAYANTTLSINNNNLRATANSSGAYGLSQSLSLNTSKKYIVTADINVDNASGGTGNLRIATNVTLGTNVTTLSTATGTITTTFTPVASTMYIGVVDTANSSSNYVEINNISVKEVTDADFDFDRNSTGTRVNEDYLIEDVPYNLASYSENISIWDNFRVDVELSNVLNPFKSGYVYLVDDGTVTDNHYRKKSYIFLDSNNTYTQSFFVKKKDDGVYPVLRTSGVGGNSFVTFNWDTETLVQGSDITSSKVEKYNYGWYRISMVFSNLATTDFIIGISNDVNDDLPTYTGSNKGFYVWGCQIVKGDQPKEYLKTTDRLDIPRIDYTNGEPSILLEPQRTNLVLKSNDISNGGGNSLSNLQINSSNNLSPEGINNAQEIEVTSASQPKVESVAVSNATLYAVSGYVKKVTGDFFGLGFYQGDIGNQYAKFNLDTGTFVAVQSNGVTSQSATNIYNCEIIAYKNNWYRITCNILTGSDASKSNFKWMAMSESAFNSGVVGDKFLIYGRQAEQASYATSLIHTSGSTVTRSADAANNAGNSDLINSTEGVIYAEIKALADDGTFRLITISAGANNNIVKFGYRSTSQAIYYEVRSGNVSQAFQIYTTQDVLEYHKVAIKYKENDFDLDINGSEVMTDNSGIVPVGMNSLQFESFVGNCKMVAVFKEALTDLELEKLTGYNNHELYMNYYNRLSYLGLVEEYNVESDINNYIL